jgi:cytochrome c-type biogenesis protein
LGLFRFAALYREARVVAKAGRRLGRLHHGLAFGLGCTPCIGPILAAILAVAASQETIGRGIALLAVYSAGLGLPFLLVALAIEPFIHLIKRFRPYFGAIERVIGVLLVARNSLFDGIDPGFFILAAAELSSPRQFGIAVSGYLPSF